MIQISNSSAIAQDLFDFPEDAIRATGSFSDIQFCNINDTLSETDSAVAATAHRDAIQLIPPHHNSRQQFAASKLSNILMQQNTINSIGHLQGVFGGDGLFSNITILNNTINTISAHKISINGLLSGWISGNTDSDGKPVKVNLEPLKIGGGGIGGLVYVLSFDDEKYDPLSEIVPEKELDYVVDNRQNSFKSGAAYIRNFRLAEFREKAMKVCKDDVDSLFLSSEFNDAQQMAYWFQVLAMQCGDVVKK